MACGKRDVMCAGCGLSEPGMLYGPCITNRKSFYRCAGTGLYTDSRVMILDKQSRRRLEDPHLPQPTSLRELAAFVVAAAATGL